MIALLWDASALVKRYLPEVGSPVVDALFGAVPTSSMSVTYLGYAETTAILRRRLNQGSFDVVAFNAARDRLRDEVLLEPDFTLLSISDTDVLSGIGLTDRHNLNSTDAAILSAFLRHAQVSNTASTVLVAADQRLLRATAAEGLRTLNPEFIAPADVPPFLASL